MKPSILLLLTVAATIFSACNLANWPLVNAQSSIPAKFDGFVYKNRGGDLDSVIIEAFFDPVCPYSRDAWPPLQKVLDLYGSRVTFILHPFALRRYHDNAFVTSRALHIIHKLNSTATYNLLELFFKHQEKFYSLQTNLSRASIVKKIVKFSSRAVGKSYYSKIEEGFNDRKTDLLTRVSFKVINGLISWITNDNYACTRGVFGTPTFFVNGFTLPDTESSLDYDAWRKIIDPLSSQQSLKRDDLFHHF
ncbi:Thioredoxin-like fold [Dillenia turbinata]|uniref:Thioredoxin-like fold n=1 Tax=Dillenia turbinata TaxID=194707 RepID=A0AAN8ZMC6_9MAGN